MFQGKYLGRLTDYQCFHSSTAAAAAKSLQSCMTLCDPMDSSPPGSSVPGILQARILEWVAISFSNALLQSRGQILTSALLFTLPCPLLPAGLALQFLGLVVQVSWIGSTNKSYSPSCHVPDLGPHKVSIQINRTVLRNTVWICLPYKLTPEIPSLRILPFGSKIFPLKCKEKKKWGKP